MTIEKGSVVGVPFRGELHVGRVIKVTDDGGIIVKMRKGANTMRSLSKPLAGVLPGFEDVMLGTEEFPNQP